MNSQDKLLPKPVYQLTATVTNNNIPSAPVTITINTMRLTKVFWGADLGLIYGLGPGEGTEKNVAHFSGGARMYYKPVFNIEFSFFVNKYFPPVGANSDEPALKVVNADIPAYGAGIEYNWTKKATPLVERISFGFCYQRIGLINKSEEKGTAHSGGFGITKRLFLNLTGVTFSAYYYPHSFSNSRVDFIEFKAGAFIQPNGRIYQGRNPKYK